MTGELNYEIVKRYVDDVIVIDDDAIAEGLRQLLFSAKLLAEPAGAAGVGALLSGAVPVREGERVAAVVSGGNVDSAKLVSILAS
jgi:threonine dehydratase